MANFGKFGAIHCIFCKLIIVSDMENYTFITINSICYCFGQLTKMSRLNCNYSFSVDVVTLPVIFVSSANFDVLQVRLSSISLT